MLSLRLSALVLGLFSCTALALPIKLKREVPQEHSHESIIISVRASLNINNPDGIVDPVFALLGDAAAAAGAGDVTDLACLQQIVADQAFTNAKLNNDIEGMTNALIFRALERNTGSVGLASELCDQTAVNAEIEALQQHQDPASDNAASINQAVALELSVQIASIGGNPLDALKSGTFAPGQIGDPTAKGAFCNTCDDANDELGCIFSLNLLVDDVSEEEIQVAISSAGLSFSPSATEDISSSVNVAPTPSPSAAAAGGNLQTFSGNLGGITAPVVTTGGKGFVTDGSDFVNLAAALGRSCDVQHNQCANAANSGGGFSVGDCDSQDSSCKAAAST